MDTYATIAALMKALGHPVRLQILQVLRQGEACVCHLEASLGQRQAYISQQLMKLREAGLVKDRREGLNVFYSLASSAVGDLLDVAVELAGQVEDAPGQTLELVLPNIKESCTCPRCSVTFAIESRGQAGN
ncbi:MAG: metalloregulator ArsR/SmtB family transcription factor [Anaerolineae bacterium]